MGRGGAHYGFMGGQVGDGGAQGEGGAPRYGCIGAEAKRFAGRGGSH